MGLRSIMVTYSQVSLALCLLSGCSFSDHLNRKGKNLLGTFPFNAQEGDLHQHHGDHHGHNGRDHDDHHGAGHHDTSSLSSRAIRQGDAGADVSFGAVAGSSPGSDGKRCIDKVEMVEETEYEKIAFNETVQICREPLIKDCDVQGDEICRTEYESECWTKQEVNEVDDDVVECETVIEEKCEDETSGYTTNTRCSKWPKEVCNVSKKAVKKYTPITGCTKEPRELCAPAGCGFKQGPEECYDKVQTVVQDSPVEQCTLEPQRTCKHVTKLVPKLEPKEECVDVPKEVCTRSRTNPRKVSKPVVKKWCYVPSEESGLA